MPRRVNDPHVDEVVFSIENRPTLAYSDDAPPIDHEELGFRVTVKNQTVRFQLKEHFATKDEALKAIHPYVRNWEMDACLRGRPGDFRLRFEDARIIDRNPPPPTPETVDISVQITAGAPTATVSAQVEKLIYPAPPSGLTLKADNPDVATMYHRLTGYYEGREPLPSMAYFCLSVIERRFRRRKRKMAAMSYHIEEAVLNEVGRLSSTKGGAASARKAPATGTELSATESRFLEIAVKKIIHRAAEVAQDPGASLSTVTLADLSDRS